MNTMKRWHGHKNIGLFLLRLIIGFFLILHGINKLQNMGATTAFFSSQGFSSYFVYISAFLETVGGILIVLGIWTRTFALLLALEFIIIALKIRFPIGGIKAAELEMLYLASLLCIFFAGAGRIALMRHKCGCCDKCEGGKCGCANGVCTECGCTAK